MDSRYDNPYQAPGVENTAVMDSVRYGGFWLRVAATMIDSVLIMIVTLPIFAALYGVDYFTGEASSILAEVLVNWVLPMVVVLIFWFYRAATPGKMALKLYIADAGTFDRPGKGQLVGRYLAYFVSALPLLLGYFWIGWDSRKQGFHDKLSRTVVLVGRPPWIDNG